MRARTSSAAPAHVESRIVMADLGRQQDAGLRRGGADLGNRGEQADVGCRRRAAAAYRGASADSVQDTTAPPSTAAAALSGWPSNSRKAAPARPRSTVPHPPARQGRWQPPDRPRRRLPRNPARVNAECCCGRGLSARVPRRPRLQAPVDGFDDEVFGAQRNLPGALPSTWTVNRNRLSRR